MLGTAHLIQGCEAKDNSKCRQLESTLKHAKFRMGSTNPAKYDNTMGRLVTSAFHGLHLATANMRSYGLVHGITCTHHIRSELIDTTQISNSEPCA